MYSAFQLAIHYLRYRFTAANGRGHGMHSPFVFDFIQKVLNNRNYYPGYAAGDALRSRMLKDNRMLSIEDHGAGSSSGNSTERTVSSIAKNAAKPRKFAELLYRMVQFYQPENIIELGTSLGITTTYLSLAKPEIPVTTLEGATGVAEMARENFQTLGLANVTLVEGNFDDTLQPLLEKSAHVDFVFIDGNHRKEPTLRYFSQLLEKIQPNSILIFDDIHWSREMEEAWQAISAHEKVRCTIDLFFIGIVFFRSEFRQKQHFTVRF